MGKRLTRILIGIGSVVLVYAVVVFLSLIPEMIEKMKANQQAQVNSQALNQQSSSNTQTNGNNNQGSYGFSNEGAVNVNNVTVEGANSSLSNEYEQILRALNQIEVTVDEAAGGASTSENTQAFNYEVESDNIIVQYTIKLESGKKFKSSEYAELEQLTNSLGIKAFNLDKEINKIKNMNKKVELSLNDGWKVEIRKITSAEWASINDSAAIDENADQDIESTYDRVQFYFIKQL